MTQPTDLEPFEIEIEFVGTTAAAIGSLVIAIQRADHEQIAIDVKRILDAATEYARALETKPADRALARAVERLNVGWRQP